LTERERGRMVQVLADPIQKRGGRRITCCGADARTKGKERGEGTVVTLVKLHIKGETGLCRRKTGK